MRGHCSQGKPCLMPKLHYKWAARWSALHPIVDRKGTGVRVLVGISAVALSLLGCDRTGWTDEAPRSHAEKPREQVRSECASRLTYARLKEYVFDEAARIRNSDPRRLDQLAAYSVVRMERPIVKSRDDQLNITVCTGQFVLNLPPGVQDAFDGQRIIEAEVEYAAQAAADGSGLVYSMSGAEPIIYRIATLGLSTHLVPQVAATAPVAEVGKEKGDAGAAELRPEAQAPTTPPTASSQKKATVVATKRAIPSQPNPARAAKAVGSPSFKCRNAKSSSEKMVCASGSLAAADRRMSAIYYSEMASAPAQTKSALRITRDRFLAKRERCASEACVARVYEERVAEIRRIGGG